LKLAGSFRHYTIPNLPVERHQQFGLI
jgi:hypothetical protein